MPEIAEYGYTDANCTQVVVWAFGDRSPPIEYVSAEGAWMLGCDEPRALRARKVGPPIEAPELFERDFDSGLCVPRAPRVGPVFRAPEVVAPDLFVRAELNVIGSGRLRPVMAEAEDGARELLTIRDAQRDAYCWFPRPSGLHEGEELRCFPDLAAFTNTVHDVYADDSCAERVASSPMCLEPNVVLDWPRRGCDLADRFYEVGPEIDPSQVRLKTDAGCTQLPPGPRPPRYYRLGAPLDVDVFPALAHRTEGSGRLRTRRYTDSNGNVLTIPLSFVDTALSDAPCGVSDYEDGTFRCLPDDATSFAGYADPACTRPVGLWPECTTTLPSVAAQWGATPGQRSPTVYRVEARRYDGPVYVVERGACTEVTVRWPDGYVELGEALELDVVTEVVE